ncbi:transposase [Marinomonas gallaica]|uniref:transposase n=1 Tax=Marinomonas gallaica TaxID=1806667 RepID=UPI003CE59035
MPKADGDSWSGIINTSLLWCYIVDAKRFESGRHGAASLGLVPKQPSSGEKEKHKGISKQGNKYLRKQLVRCARAAYRVLQKEGATDRLAEWVKRMKSGGKHTNKIVVALANKLVRIAWSLLSRADAHYQS